MKKVYIVSAKRTAIGTLNGSLSSMIPSDFAAEVIRAVLAETGIPTAALTEVLGGSVLPAGNGQGVIRQASIRAGIPVDVPAYAINMVCGSGMKAVMLACAQAQA
ncbi:MAG: acetyl-CoA C-acyltransferase, partial [Oscillospiraceae bacterium]|nr:acetyl-CoA C-acyltransferase [Oscillospiraceae bacterium]